MIRVLFFVVAIAIIIYLLRSLKILTKPKVCITCDGKGHWRGTRGEKNPCETCHGSGLRKPMR